MGVGAAVSGALGRGIRVFGETLSVTIILVMSLAPAAGAIAVVYFLNRWSIPVALLAVASLGGIVSRRLGFFRIRQADSSEGKLSREDRTEKPNEVAAPPLDDVTDAMITFHDFNRARRRFDHW
jgi:uncharacterized integral membrane protein